MSTNKYQDHLLVLPEDQADRELATGFELEVKYPRRIQILPEVGGWAVVRDLFLAQHVKGMKDYVGRYVILLLDFDNRSKRRNEIMAVVPPDISSRVFLLGVKGEPEDLRKAGLGSFENIGRALARECRDGRREIWSHDMLNQNASELDRLEQAVRGILFGSVT